MRTRPFLLLPGAAVAAILLAVPAGATPGKTTSKEVHEPSTFNAQEIQLAPVFSHNMVLQRDSKLTFWGKGPEGSELILQLEDQRVAARPNNRGDWRLKMGPFQAGGPHDLKIIVGDSAHTLTNIMVGDVWIASGQSNMEWPLQKSANAEKDVPAAHHPNLRLLNIHNAISPTPLKTFSSDGWQVCSPESAANFSAVAYYFGRELHEQFDIPIGLIGANQGATRIETWTPASVFMRDPMLHEALTELQEWDFSGDGLSNKERNKPTGHFNAMIHPLIPFAFKGVLWYQGESNKGQPVLYERMQLGMVQAWRRLWRQGDFPFLLVQLPGFEKRGAAWPRFREAQARITALTNTAVAVAIDLGERDNVHPGNKKDVGHRLALVARDVVYGEDLVSSGPRYHSMTNEKRSIRISFTDVGGGLVDRNGGELEGFSIAAKKGTFLPAEAVIESNTVVVSHRKVKKPVAVRYAWEPFPACDLFNAEGLPAAPFRTDSFSD